MAWMYPGFRHRIEESAVYMIHHGGRHHSAVQLIAAQHSEIGCKAANLVKDPNGDSSIEPVA
jgi:hypothetical protein